MEHKPEVSVVMPVYNGARYIREAIDSILTQTQKDFEFIIINDGSNDNSEEIILSYKDPRIVYLKNQVNSKICVTLNRGLDAAKGEYIARMDCDDIALPERLEKQKRFLDTHKEVGIVGCDVIVFGEHQEDSYNQILHSDDDCKAGLLFNSCFAHPAVMFRRSLLEEHHLRYREEYKGLEDLELWWRLSKLTKFANLNDYLLRYRIHSGQETQNVITSVSEKSAEFIQERFRFYVPSLSEQELRIVSSYCYGKWHEFDDERLNVFISVCKKIIRSSKVRERKSFTRAMAITLSKAIVFAKANSSEVRQSAWTIDNKAFLAGIMPFDWYLKFSFHHLLRR